MGAGCAVFIRKNGRAQRKIMKILMYGWDGSVSVRVSEYAANEFLYVYFFVIKQEIYFCYLVIIKV